MFPCCTFTGQVSPVNNKRGKLEEMDLPLGILLSASYAYFYGTGTVPKVLLLVRRH